MNSFVGGGVFGAGGAGCCDAVVGKVEDWVRCVQRCKGGCCGSDGADDEVDDALSLLGLGVLGGDGRR